jgi:diaminohydroxyphosphoribosylaminopyrimidine deaminase/5-amino-6-(5-phosphoribosylamino)uracil reductase
MRARADAILVGGGTWRADAPRLDVRLPGLEERSPGAGS